MLDPNLGGLQSPKISLSGLNEFKPVALNPEVEDEPTITPNAVFFEDNMEQARAGDVILTENGPMRLEGGLSFKLTPTVIKVSDYEWNRGDIRRHD